MILMSGLAQYKIVIKHFFGKIIWKDILKQYMKLNNNENFHVCNVLKSLKIKVNLVVI